jgi:hypothetical protein
LINISFKNSENLARPGGTHLSSQHLVGKSRPILGYIARSYLKKILKNKK